MPRAVQQALALLDHRSRRLLVLLSGLQFILAIMDLIGVLLIGVVAALGTASISGQSIPFMGGFLQWLEDRSFGDLDPIFVLAVLAGTLLVGKSLLSFFLVRRSYKFLANRQAMISSRLAELLLSRPLLDVQRKPSQEVAYALTGGVNAATIGVLGGAVIIVAELSMLIVMAIGLLAVDAVLAIFTGLFFGAIALTLNQALGGWARRLGSELTYAEIASNTSILEAIKSYREVTVSGRRGLFVQRFEVLRWKAAFVQSDVQILGQVSKYIFEVALIVGGAILVFSQLTSKDLVGAIGILAVFLAAASRIMPSLLRMQQALIGIRTAAGTAEPTFVMHRELANDPDALVADQHLLARVMHGIESQYSSFSPDLKLSEVSLSYPGSARPAVESVTLTVPAGSSLALVGPTGAGKSTLADLILGVIQPDSGSVELSNVNPAAAISRWPGAIAYVPQDISIVYGSVRANVALGIPEAMVSDDLVWEALSRAHLADLLKSEREGLDTIVGEHGVRLSGGQRQRLGLARALYTRPKLLVLDEATSALDAETEHAVSTALQELEGEISLVLVAHRLATIRNCSQIAYMEHGKVVALGDFEAVRAAQPNFDRQANLMGL